MKECDCDCGRPSHERWCPSYEHLAPLVGRTIEAAYKYGEYIYLVFIDGQIARLHPDGDCCSHCYIAGATLTEALTLATVTSIENLVKHEVENDQAHEVSEVWGHRIHTTRGTCTLEMRLEHNGYYSGRLEFRQGPITIPAGAKPLEDW